MKKVKDSFLEVIKNSFKLNISNNQIVIDGIKINVTMNDKVNSIAIHSVLSNKYNKKLVIKALEVATFGRGTDFCWLFANIKSSIENISIICVINEYTYDIFDYINRFINAVKNIKEIVNV